MSHERVEAAAKAIAVYSDCDWELEAGKARDALAAADSVMFSEAAIGRAENVVLNHWRQTSTGKCECGQFVSKDPQQIARHLTLAVVAALREES